MLAVFVLLVIRLPICFFLFFFCFRFAITRRLKWAAVQHLKWHVTRFIDRERLLA